MTPRHTRRLAPRGTSAAPSAIEIASARWEAVPITLAAIDHACDPTTPAWMLCAIEEAAGRLGEPRAWRWQAGDVAGTVLHFTAGKIGHRSYASAIQAGDAAATPVAETIFAACAEGIIAAIQEHLEARI